MGDMVRIVADLTYTGIIMSRYEHSDDVHITLKLQNGYNVGIRIDRIKRVETVQRTKDGTSPDHPKQRDGAGRIDGVKQAGTALPKILLLSTGGTIASSVDYRTGAVTPVLGAEDLVSYVPELAEIAEIDTNILLSEHSENITPDHWLMMANTINGYSESDYAGIIVAHGTDTMHYTSSFLSFALAGFPIPIALVGAQRSSDRASSDAPLNLLGAARLLTQARTKGVYVVMHMDSSDDRIACHVGTRVRKNHTSRRGAFQTIGAEPAFVISGKQIQKNMRNNFFGSSQFTPQIGLDTRVALVKYHPGYDAGMLDHIIDSGYRAIVFEGTGLGHTGKNTYASIQRAHEKGVFVAMTSQCIDGMVAMTVYESGRDLLDLGVVPLRDMIPETALVKTMWAAGHAKDATQIKRIVLKGVASEMPSVQGGGWMNARD